MFMCCCGLCRLYGFLKVSYGWLVLNSMESILCYRFLVWMILCSFSLL